jgi:hypothetical protein
VSTLLKVRQSGRARYAGTNCFGFGPNAAKPPDDTIKKSEQALLAIDTILPLPQVQKLFLRARSGNGMSMPEK